MITDSFSIILQVATIVGLVIGAFWGGMKWVDKKRELTDGKIDLLRTHTNEKMSDLSQVISTVRIELTNHINSLDLKSAERYATWAALKEFKEDFKNDLNSRFDRHEANTLAQFDRIFREIETIKKENHA